MHWVVPRFGFSDRPIGHASSFTLHRSAARHRTYCPTELFRSLPSAVALLTSLELHLAPYLDLPKFFEARSYARVR